MLQCHVSILLCDWELTSLEPSTAPFFRMVRNLTMEFVAEILESAPPESRATDHGTHFPVQPFPVLVKG